MGIGGGEGLGSDEGLGLGDTTGMVSIFSGRISKSAAAATLRVRVSGLYEPVAKMRLPGRVDKSMFSGTSRMMASEEVVSR